MLKRGLEINIVNWKGSHIICPVQISNTCKFNNSQSILFLSTLSINFSKQDLAREELLGVFSTELGRVMEARNGR